jgi:nucleotide-binding universal stress UspA family protein
MKILLAVDGSNHTQRMLDYIALHKELLGAGNRYIAFTVVPSVPSGAARFIDKTVIEDHYREEAERVLAPVREFATGHGWDISTVHAHGRASDAIAAYAQEQKADLIVMGTHGHSLLSNMALGSVANGVLSRCTVPVLLVR